MVKRQWKKRSRYEGSKSQKLEAYFEKLVNRKIRRKINHTPTRELLDENFDCSVISGIYDTEW
jgi:hypothetical protein